MAGVGIPVGSGRRWWISAHVMLFVCVSLFAVSTVPGIRPRNDYDVLLDGGLSNLGYLCAACVCFLRSQRTCDYLLAAAITLYGLGNLGWGVFVRPLAEQPFPSLADACFLGFYPLTFVALLLIADGGATLPMRGLWLDGVVAGLAVSAVAFTPVGPDLVGAPMHWLATPILLAYPLCDVALVIATTATVTRFGWRPPIGIWLLAGGVSLFIAADLAHLVGVQNDSFTSGGPVDAVWVVAVALMSLTPGWADVPVGPRLPHLWLVSIPVLATALALFLLVLDHFRPLHAATVIFAALAILLGLVRLLVSLREVVLLADSRELAHTDELTGLGNRRALFATAPASIAACTPGSEVALLLMDIDRFKEINDSLGHTAGDTMLRQISQRLIQGSESANETVARLGGDEFAVLLPGVGQDGARTIADRLAAVIAEPLDLDGNLVRASASIGIAVSSASDADMSTLLRQADVAMYHAKAHRLGSAQYHTSIDEFVAGDRLATVELLRLAITNGQLVLHYQPQINSLTGQVDGVEALVRWQHPTRGLLAPDAFLPLVESSGLMGEMTTAVLNQALDECMRWSTNG